MAMEVLIPPCNPSGHVSLNATPIAIPSKKLWIASPTNTIQATDFSLESEAAKLLPWWLWPWWWLPCEWEWWFSRLVSSWNAVLRWYSFSFSSSSSFCSHGFCWQLLCSSIFSSITSICWLSAVLMLISDEPGEHGGIVSWFSECNMF